MINDAAFWRAREMGKLSAEDRYLLFYLLTSPFGGVSGLFQIDERIAAAELGWSGEQFSKVLRRLQDSSVIEFDEDSGFVWLKVWWAHNSLDGAVGPKLAEKMAREIQDAPPSLRDGYLLDMQERGIDTLSIPYPCPIDTPRLTTTCTTKTNITTTTTTGDGDELVFPAGLAGKKEKQAAARLLAGMSATDAQQILDVLSASDIKKSPMALLGSLVRAHLRGEFDSTPGLHIAISREKRSRRQAELERADEIAKQKILTAAPPPTEFGARFDGLTPGIRRKQQ